MNKVYITRAGSLKQKAGYRSAGYKKEFIEGDLYFLLW